MDSQTIRHQLALALRPVDTTTGRPAPGSRFRLNGDELRLYRRDSGHYIAVGSLPEEFHLRVEAGGFEPWERTVRPAELGETPYLEIPLIPVPSPFSKADCFTLEGSLPGLRWLEGVPLGTPDCMIRSYDARTREITLVNPHSLELDHPSYGVVSPDRSSFQILEIGRRISGQCYRLMAAPETKPGEYSPLVRIVWGRVTPEGAYLFRCRQEGRNVPWLLRCRTEENLWFQQIDWSSPEAKVLRPPAPEPAVREDAASTVC